MPVTFNNAKSVRERIVLNVVSTLQGITTANGYHVTIGSVQRYEQAGMRVKDMPACIVQIGDEEAKNGPLPMTTKKLRVWVIGITRRDEDSAQTIDEALDVLLLDIECAMMQDRTRGALAVTTTPADALPFEYLDKSGVVHPYVAVGFEITYRHDHKDPTKKM